jgi:hypothetical protein
VLTKALLSRAVSGLVTAADVSSVLLIVSVSYESSLPASLLGFTQRAAGAILQGRV